MFEDKILFYAMRHEKTTECVGGLVEVLHILTGLFLPTPIQKCITAKAHASVEVWTGSHLLF